MSIASFAIEMQEANLLDSGDMRVGEDIQETTVLCQVPTNQPEKPIRAIRKKTLQNPPIRPLIESWQFTYSTQCLRRMISIAWEREFWHATYGVCEWQATHWINVAYLESVLDDLDEQRELVAA